MRIILRIMPVLLLLMAPAIARSGEKAAATAPAQAPWERITDAQIDAIRYDDADVDDAYVTPLAPDLSRLDNEARDRLDVLALKMDDWKPGQEKEIGQNVRYWISLCTLTDITYGEFEAEVPYVIFERLKKDVPQAKLIKALAWVILKPDAGKVVVEAPSLGLDVAADEQEVRARSQIYAKKLLGRLLHKLPRKPE